MVSPFPRPNYNPAMRRLLPNQLTVLRLLLAGVFVVLLNLYRYPYGPDWVLPTAFVVFIVAAVTDWLDGYLARRWHVESAFGRIMDPFCDKVLTIAAFICLSGPRFVIPEPVVVRGHETLTTVSGIYPWMVVLILARELLVTGIRDEMESQGVKFGAKLSGKLKTLIQLVAIPVLLVIVWLEPREHGDFWLVYLRRIVVYAVVLVTLVSGWPYVVQAAGALRGNAGKDA